MTNRWVHALWCDDIRQELGNKPSLMGIYTNAITIPSLPIALHRIAVYTTIVTEVDNPIKKLAFKIVRDDGFVLANLQQDAVDYDSALDKTNGDATRLAITIAVTLNNIEIPEGCKYLQVLVQTESESLDGSKLYINVDLDAFPVVTKET
ncbi:MAG: hypothetical protein WAX77_09225 [Methylococcaceae bacterium]